SRCRAGGAAAPGLAHDRVERRGQRLVAGEVSRAARLAAGWRWYPPRRLADRATPWTGPDRGLEIFLERLPGHHTPGRDGRVCASSPLGGAVSRGSENGTGLGSISGAALGWLSSARPHGDAELQLSGLAGRKM